MVTFLEATKHSLCR